MLGGVLPSPVVKAVLDAVGGAYIVEQGSVPFTVVDAQYDTPMYYRVWSNGFKEMWQGRAYTNNNVQITFPLEFSDTNYCLIGVGDFMANIAALRFIKSTTGFTTTFSTREVCNYGWYACGY